MLLGYDDSFGMFIILQTISCKIDFQAGFAFSCCYLSAFFTCIGLIFAGGKLNAQNLAVSSSFCQGLTGIFFGMLEFIAETELFLALSYVLR